MSDFTHGARTGLWVGYPRAGLVVRLGALDSDTSGFKFRLGHLEALCPRQACVLICEMEGAYLSKS